MKYYVTSQNINFSTWSAGAIGNVDMSSFPFTVDKIVGCMAKVDNVTAYCGLSDGSPVKIAVMTPSSISGSRGVTLRIAYIP